MPVSWSTYALSVSIRSFNGFNFLGFESEPDDGEVGVIGVEGVKGTTRPAQYIAEIRRQYSATCGKKQTRIEGAKLRNTVELRGTSFRKFIVTELWG